MKPGRIIKAFLLLLAVIAAGSRLARAAGADRFDSEAVSLMMAGYEALEGEQYEQALQLLERARKLDKNSMVIRTLYGEALFSLERYDEVIDLLERDAEKIEQPESEVLSLLAYSYEEKGDNGKAIRWYKKIIKQDPQDEWNRRRMLELLKDEERFQELIVLYKPLLNPGSRNYPLDLFHIGALYFRIGGLKPAREYLTQALRADSTLADACQLLGNLEENDRNWDKALGYYLDYLKLRPTEAGQMLPRVLITARQAMSYSPPAGEAGAISDSAAWAGFIDELDSRGDGAGTSEPAMLRVMAIGNEAVGRFERAIEINRKLAEADPADRFARRSLLRLYYSTGKYMEMIPIYEDIIDPRDPVFPGDALQLGALYLKKGEREKGRSYLQRSIEADETMARAHQMLGHLAEQEQDWDAALDCYTRFLELEPEALRESFKRLAETSLKAERPEVVAGILQDAIARGDTSAWAAEQLGWMDFYSGRYDESHEVLKKLRRQNRISENGMYVLGLTQMRREQYGEAARAFAAVNEKAPAYYLAYLARSNSLMLMGNTEKAGEVLRLGLTRVDENNAEGRRELMYALANICHELGEEDQAEQWLRRVLRLSPGYAPALNYLGYFYADLGRNLDEALRLIKQALEQDPENGHYLDSMGWVLFKLGRAESALEYIRNSLENLKKQQREDREYSEVYEHLGDIYLALGQTELAREAFNSSLEIDSGNQEVERKLEELEKGR